MQFRLRCRRDLDSWLDYQQASRIDFDDFMIINQLNHFDRVLVDDQFVAMLAAWDH